MRNTGFFSSLGKRKLGVVLNLFYAYMSLGLVLIMLGSILPEMKADYALSYQVGGALLSVQSVGYVLAGLLAGYLPYLRNQDFLHPDTAVRDCGLHYAFGQRKPCLASDRHVPDRYRKGRHHQL